MYYKHIFWLQKFPNQKDALKKKVAVHEWVEDNYISIHWLRNYFWHYQYLSGSMILLICNVPLSNLNCNVSIAPFSSCVPLVHIFLSVLHRRSTHVLETFSWWTLLLHVAIDFSPWLTHLIFGHSINTCVCNVFLVYCNLFRKLPTKHFSSALWVTSNWFPQGLWYFIIYIQIASPEERIFFLGGFCMKEIRVVEKYCPFFPKASKCLLSLQFWAQLIHLHFCQQSSWINHPSNCLSKTEQVFYIGLSCKDSFRPNSSGVVNLKMLVSYWQMVCVVRDCKTHWAYISLLCLSW